MVTFVLFCNSTFLSLCIFTSRQRSCVKIIFSVVSVYARGAGGSFHVTAVDLSEVVQLGKRAVCLRLKSLSPLIRMQQPQCELWFVSNVNSNVGGMRMYHLKFKVHSYRAMTTNTIRGFHKHTTLAIMPILASEALECENKKSSSKMLPPVGIEPTPLITSDSKSNTILSRLTWHVLVRRSLNFCSCTT